MGYFDELEKDKEEKEKFVKTYKRNQKIMRYVFGFLYIGLGILFICLGIGLYFVEPIMLYAFIGIGPLFLILGIVFFIVFGKLDANKAYDRMKRRIESGKPIYSTYQMSSRIIMLENKVKNLEEEIESIKKNYR